MFGVVAPVLETREAVGIPTPHCTLLFAVGAAGKGLIVTSEVAKELMQPVVGFVAVTVYVWFIADPVLLIAVVVPVAEEIEGDTFQDHEYAEELLVRAVIFQS
jgi:hypothetical protein